MRVFDRVRDQFSDKKSQQIDAVGADEAIVIAIRFEDIFPANRRALDDAPRDVAQIVSNVDPRVVIGLSSQKTMDARDRFDAMAAILEEPYRIFLGERFQLRESPRLQTQ